MMNKEMKMEIEDLINSVVDQDFSKAAPTFAEIMRDKMDDALEQEKIAQADQIFNGHEPDEEESMEDDDDISDEELDDAIDETEEELEDT
jgi:hypothetical protein